VAVIREEDGQRVMYQHDLRSKDLFESPCFYLQQNDIVYVEPKYRKQDREDKGWKYIKDPLVSLEFLNFKYSVLGAVGNTGTFSVEGDRITLLEAIAKAGDVTQRGRVNRVAVIREEDGQRVMYQHDLRSKDLFESPCFYLQHNDIVYVEPKYRKQDREDKGWKYTTGILSFITAVCSVIWAIK